MSKKIPLDTDLTRDQDAILRGRGYISAQEIAKKMGITPQSVHRWAEAGEVESEMISHKRWVTVTSLIKHLGPKQAEIFGFVPEPASKRKKD